MEETKKEALKMKALQYAVENLKNYPVEDKANETIKMAMSFYDFLKLDVEISKECLNITPQAQSVPRSLTPKANTEFHGADVLEEDVIDYINNHQEAVNSRWMAIARTDMQKAFMALRRALYNKE